ncbi:hypothetical protein SAMN05216391_10849 [Lachnospiraceae bacterium KHCPX20]|nr:hypothetical protein SAMN05216391_10849 [Lachnospiraceae bacterium KHCPX20]
MSNETNLREAENQVNVEGLVSEMDFQDKKDAKTQEVIGLKGHITVKTGDTSFIKFSLNCNRLKKDGSPNSLYKGFETIRDTYKSIADVGEENADRVRITKGNINLYTDARSMTTRVGFKSNFFNRVTEDFEPKAEFEVEMFIKSVAPEVDTKGMVTGRAVVTGWMPTYNGIEPLTLIAPEDIANDIQSIFAAGQTTKFFGKISNNRVTKVTQIPVVIGKPKEKVETINKTELIIENAVAPYEEGITPVAPYNSETINAAIAERKRRLEEEHNGNNFTPASQSKPSGAKMGRTLGF